MSILSKLGDWMFGPKIIVPADLPEFIDPVDIEPDYVLAAKKYSDLEEGEPPVDYEAVDQDAKIFSLREVAIICATMEDLLKEQYEKEITHQAKPSRKTASRPRSRGRKSNPKGKASGRVK